ncbi:hypothetical protein [Nocardia wallacei]|uniref:hypothetical protein n=1 Tax=Nocardia wallacei TaxID=480035 RepID=UPI001656E8C5|nr:hypothetical protein [Nocardia wallacei]
MRAVDGQRLPRRGVRVDVGPATGIGDPGVFCLNLLAGAFGVDAGDNFARVVPFAAAM